MLGVPLETYKAGGFTLFGVAVFGLGAAVIAYFVGGEMEAGETDATAMAGLAVVPFALLGA